MKTSVVPISAPKWYTVDCTGQNLGRIAAKVAMVLRGKHLPSFSPHQLCGDHVIIMNVEKLAFHPKRLLGKLYRRHTGYLGHLFTTTLEKMMETKPERVMEKAVKGMLPYNRMKFQLMKRLHVFKGTDHPYAPQKPVPLNLSKI